MIRSNRGGFTLVEMLVVVVLTGIILGATYQSLITQERTARTTNEIIRGQDALRAAVGIMEAELREAATMGGDSIGLPDLVGANRDSITVRAARKIGFVCDVHASERRMNVWVLASRDLFRVGDGIYVYADGDPGAPHRWLAARVQNVSSSNAACPSRPAGSGAPAQRVDLGNIDNINVTGGYLDPVRPGSPVRGFERVTYGLFQFGNEWGLGRVGSADGATPQPLVLGLAAPGQGLVFSYLNAGGDVIGADPVPLDQVAGVRIAAVTRPRPGSDASPVEVTSDIFFRNN